MSIPIHIAIEDPLSEAVSKRILQASGQEFAVGATLGGKGSGYLKKNIRGFNQAARVTPFFVLTDLDEYECPPRLVDEWLHAPQSPNLIFRVACREVEAWLVADRMNLLKFLRCGEKRISQEVELIADPKEFIMNLASKSTSREIREEMVPPYGSSRRQGPNYNGRMIEFVETYWDLNIAKNNSPSLQKTILRISEFTPSWHSERE